MAVIWGIEPWFQLFRQSNEIEIGASYRVTFNDREVQDNPLFVEAVFLREYRADEEDLDFGYYSGWVKTITSVGRHRRRSVSDEMYMIHEEASIRPDGRFQHFRDWSRRFDYEDFEANYGDVNSFSVVALVAPAYPGDVESSIASRPDSLQPFEGRHRNGEMAVLPTHRSRPVTHRPVESSAS